MGDSELEVKMTILNLVRAATNQTIIAAVNANRTLQHQTDEKRRIEWEEKHDLDDWGPCASMGRDAPNLEDFEDKLKAAEKSMSFYQETLTYALRVLLSGKPEVGCDGYAEAVLECLWCRRKEVFYEGVERKVRAAELRARRDVLDTSGMQHSYVDYQVEQADEAVNAVERNLAFLDKVFSFAETLFLLDGGKKKERNEG